IDAALKPLTLYSHDLGYPNARVGRTIGFDESGRWATLRFILVEGPRYKVRSVTMEGNKKFASAPVLNFLKLKSGDYFNKALVNKDAGTMIDLYGSQGHVFADIQPDLRYLEEPAQLDLIYKIKEGERFKVGDVNVNIAGEFPRTKTTVVLNRMSQRPGDIIDTRLKRNDERRLQQSSLFAGNQNDGEPPRIVIRPPDASSLNLADDPPPQTTVRGQEPEPPRAAYQPQRTTGMPR